MSGRKGGGQMLSIMGMTITGSLGATILLLGSATETVALSDAFLAYLIGGLTGFALAVLLSPATIRSRAGS